MPKKIAERLTYREIADRYGKSRSLVVNGWVKREGWPEPVGRRGAALEFDAGEVDRFYTAHIQPPALEVEGDDDELITLTEMAALAGYSSRESLGSMVTRGTWPGPVGKRRRLGASGEPTEVWERYWRLGDVRPELRRRK